MIKLIKEYEECPKGYLRYKYDALRKCWFAAPWAYAVWLRLWTRLGDKLHRFLQGKTLIEELDSFRREIDEVHYTVRLKNAEIRTLQMELKAKDMELQLMQERFVRRVSNDKPVAIRVENLPGEGGL